MSLFFHRPHTNYKPASAWVNQFTTIVRTSPSCAYPRPNTRHLPETTPSVHLRPIVSLCDLQPSVAGTNEREPSYPALAPVPDPILPSAAFSISSFHDASAEYSPQRRFSLGPCRLVAGIACPCRVSDDAFLQTTTPTDHGRTSDCATPLVHRPLSSIPRAMHRAGTPASTLRTPTHRDGTNNTADTEFDTKNAIDDSHRGTSR